MAQRIISAQIRYKNISIMSIVFCYVWNQGRTAAFCLGASSCHLQSDNKMSPTNLKANFCTFLSILYKTAGKLVVFWRFVGWWAICINISSDHSQISCFSYSFLIKFSKTWKHLQSDIIYSPTSGASTRRPRRPFPYGPVSLSRFTSTDPIHPVLR